MQLREAPLEYNGAMANLELEFRIRSADLPPSASDGWLNVEVQTAKTRPEGTVIWSAKRVKANTPSFRSYRDRSIDREAE
jgi:hypothetical protein